jgi:hypothetical protein
LRLERRKPCVCGMQTCIDRIQTEERLMRARGERAHLRA